MESDFMSMRDTFRQANQEFKDSMKKGSEERKQINIEAEIQLEKIRVRHAEKIRKIEENRVVYDFDTQKEKWDKFFSKKSVKLISKTIFWLLIIAIFTLVFLYFTLIHLIIGVIIVCLLMKFFLF